MLHVVFGTGPAGCWTARALVDQGLTVRAVNRSGKRPALIPDAVEMVAVEDASHPKAAIDAASGAAVIYQCLNPPYHRWPELFPPLQRAVVAAASAMGARLVSLENLYMYGETEGAISEASPERATTRKGTVRRAMARELLEAHSRGEIQVAIGRAADYYGPGVTASQFGERTFGPLLKGRAAEVTGHADLPHALAFIPDVGRALALLGTRPEALGKAWIVPHAPARTQREMLDIVGRRLGRPVRLRVMGPLMMRIGGLFVPEARESVEMMYQFTRPFLVDSSLFERTFGMAPTPLEVGLAETTDWWASR